MLRFRHNFQDCFLTLVAIDGHEAVSLVVPGLGGIGTVDRNLVVVGTQSVAVGVCIGEQATLRGGGRRRRRRRRRGEGEEWCIVGRKERVRVVYWARPISLAQEVGVGILWLANCNINLSTIVSSFTAQVQSS